MKTICLSPHLDDAVFSCGGWIWEQVHQGQDVEIWTVFAGDPPAEPLSDLAKTLHEKWKLGRDVVQLRREEDIRACQFLGVEPRHLPYPDCIYRKTPSGEAYYRSIADLSGGIDSREVSLIDQVSAQLAAELPAEVEILVPLGIGNHVDHEITRKAASRLERPLMYYADVPYVQEGEGRNILRFMMESPDWQARQFPVTDAGMDKWIQAILMYGSQVFTFWEDEGQIKEEISEFTDFLGAMTLWRAQED
jgi:LmbE family N-acetylglucosaminyl deacetylase